MFDLLLIFILGLSWFLKYSNDDFFEKELLPQLWHLLTDKYVEKRLLVAEACSWFSPLINVSSRMNYSVIYCNLVKIH